MTNEDQERINEERKMIIRTLESEMSYLRMVVTIMKTYDGYGYAINEKGKKIIREVAKRLKSIIDEVEA